VWRHARSGIFGPELTALVQNSPVAALADDARAVRRSTRGRRRVYAAGAIPPLPKSGAFDPRTGFHRADTRNALPGCQNNGQYGPDLIVAVTVVCARMLNFGPREGAECELS